MIDYLRVPLSFQFAFGFCQSLLCVWSEMRGVFAHSSLDQVGMRVKTGVCPKGVRGLCELSCADLNITYALMLS
jgi:hypothetical protein